MLTALAIIYVVIGLGIGIAAIFHGNKTGQRVETEDYILLPLFSVVVWFPCLIFVIYEEIAKRCKG